MKNDVHMIGLPMSSISTHGNSHGNGVLGKIIKPFGFLPTHISIVGFMMVYVYVSRRRLSHLGAL